MAAPASNRFSLRAKLLSNFTAPFVALFVLGNVFILRNLVRDRYATDAQSIPTDLFVGGHDDQPWRLENEDQQWKLVQKSRQILDYRDHEFLLHRQRRAQDAEQFALDGRVGQHRGEQLSSNAVDLDAALGRDPPTELNCAALANITASQFVASGWTKAVYKGLHNGEEVAVKQVNLYGHDMNACVKTDFSFWECYRKSAAKILKEIVLLRELRHRNVLKVLGYCIPDGDPVIREDTGGHGGVSVITELGESLDIIRLLQSSWEDRLRISLGITRLIHHLAHSPLGSLVMNDFRRQQFVLVGGELKLSDVDDMELEEPVCTTDEDCTIRHVAAELVLPVACIRSRCQGYNEKQNIYNAGRHFVSFLFPHGAPNVLRTQIDEIVTAYANVSWDSAHLLAAMTLINNLYVSGGYLDRSKNRAVEKDYVQFDQSDLPGLYDYRCQLTLSGSGCTMSVFDDLEAMEICNEDRDCRAFVITPQKSWAGRRIVHFKSNYSSSVRNEHTTLYVKVS